MDASGRLSSTSVEAVTGNDGGSHVYTSPLLRRQNVDVIHGRTMMDMHYFVQIAEPCMTTCQSMMAMQVKGYRCDDTSDYTMYCLYRTYDTFYPVTITRTRTEG